MNDNSPIPGGEFAGRYTIERELGRGGAAIVYLAFDTRQDRQVAVKVLHKELGQAIGAQRFLREIKHSSALHHPHLLAIHESGEADGFLYYVMPYMRDGSLRARLAKEKQLALDEALLITRQVGESLAYAHSRGIIHRDIKPDNVLFSVDHACLADFGIARAVDSVAADTLTSTGLVVGTPAYMSPEQASGEKEVDARSDQYSLACLLYEMITGLPPFIGATMQSVISQRFTQPPPSMRPHRPSVPDHVERAVKRALAVAPADRFASVKDFISALHDPSAVPEPVSVHAIRRRWFAVGAAAAIVTLAVVAAKPGADWVRGAWGAQLDTSRFVVLPFAADTARGDEGAAVARLLHQNLERWDGVSLVDEATSESALEDEGKGVRSLDDAIRVARNLGAGKLIWGTVDNDNTETSVTLGLYDVASRKRVRDVVYAGSRPVADSSLRSTLNALLAFPGLPPGFDNGAGGTNSYLAWQAYGHGLVELAGGNFESARQRLSDAVRIDPKFAAANLWLAYVSSILAPKAHTEWAPVAARAVTYGSALRQRDAMRARAIRGLGMQDFQTACSVARDLVRGDSLDAHAWLLFGECALMDTRLVRAGRSPSGWSFSSSWNEAGNAFLRALELEPRLHSPNVFARLRKVFTTQFNQLRPGVHFDGDSVFMYAYPIASSDTVVFVPYTADETARGLARADPVAHARAMDRNKAVQLRAARAWVSAAPQSSDAFQALAAVLETRGELSGGDPNRSALASLRRARLLARGAKSLDLTTVEVRLLVKDEQFEAARALADSVLQQARGGRATPEIVGLMSALTGRANGMAAGVRAQHFDDLNTIESPLLDAAAELLSHASLGICSPHVESLEKKVESLLVSYVEPSKMSSTRSRALDEALSLNVPCSRGSSSLRIERPVGVLLRMQRQFASGDTGNVRAGFDSLARIRRGMRASNVSPGNLVREAWLAAAIGDTVAAMRQLDGVLNALPSLPAVMLENAVQTATLVRAMALRAEIAAARSDREAARRWGRAVATLWANSDAALQPTVQRMKKLAE